MKFLLYFYSLNSLLHIGQIWELLIQSEVKKKRENKEQSVSCWRETPQWRSSRTRSTRCLLWSLKVRLQLSLKNQPQKEACKVKKKKLEVETRKLLETDLRWKLLKKNWDIRASWCWQPQSGTQAVGIDCHGSALAMLDSQRQKFFKKGFSLFF